MKCAECRNIIGIFVACALGLVFVKSESRYHERLVMRGRANTALSSCSNLLLMESLLFRLCRCGPRAWLVQSRSRYQVCSHFTPYTSNSGCIPPKDLRLS